MNDKCIKVYVDGGTVGVTYAGAAAVARTVEGFFLGWWSQQLPRMTNNEAEYQAAAGAVLVPVEAHHLGLRRVEIVSDSEVIVRQMRGLSRVNSGRLKPLHQQTCRAVADFEEVIFTYVSRTQNVLADALATEAVAGRTVQMPPGRRRYARCG